ncbi:acyltransferase [Bradyrhizobium sp. URHA0013]|uniref:acyltransferase family protein n=1 Tax=Bradyrhizobium sp. URHA0013 TaxID=1380352 RepID=UPI000560C8A8|nr:acyltransferase [Bradyrhizobium sp. URHA0013]
MNRLKHIDSIRGLAALAVIYFHIAEYATKRNLVSNEFEQYLFGFFTHYIDLGKVGVTVFFAVSGFVIPFSIFKFRTKPILSFAISRLFRLYPAYWVSLSLGVLFLFVLHDKPISPTVVLVNVSMLQQFVGVPNVIDLYWTLQVELIFYFICALLFAMKGLDDTRTVTGVGLASLAFALFLGLLRYFVERKVPVALPLALSVMFWGLAIRYHSEDRVRWRRPLVVLTVALVVVIPIVSILAYNKDMGFQETWYKYTATYYLAIALFYLLYRYVRITSPVFVYLGTISYSVYLFGPIVQERLLTGWGNGVFEYPVHVFIIATFLGTIGVASIVYRIVEAPAVTFGRRLIKRIEAGDSVSAVALEEPVRPL